jgi:hypothetical protein
LQPSTSLVIGSIYSHQVPIQSTTHPSKVVNKHGLFQFEEDSTTTPWHVSSPFNLAPVTHPLQKFKDHFPRLSGNGIDTKNEHLVSFSNSCHNIGANDNDTCMHLFVNSLEGKSIADFFDLPPKILSVSNGSHSWIASKSRARCPSFLCHGLFMDGVTEWKPTQNDIISTSKLGRACIGE